MNIPFPIWELDQPLPEATTFVAQLPSIHSSDFLERLDQFLIKILDNLGPNGKLTVMVMAVLETGGQRTVGSSFHCNKGITVAQLSSYLREAIDNFEAQSGTGESSPSTYESILQVHNITSAPEPEARPFTSSPSNDSSSSSNGSSLPPTGTSTTNGNSAPQGAPQTPSSFFEQMAQIGRNSTPIPEPSLNQTPNR
jgi:hypothetical protein